MLLYTIVTGIDRVTTWRYTSGMGTHEIIQDTAQSIIVPFALQPWERQPTEDTMWYDRFFRWYLTLGPTRGLKTAYNNYMVDKGSNPQGGTSEPWQNACARYNWQARATAYDDYQRELWAEGNANLAAYAQQMIADVSLQVMRGVSKGYQATTWEDQPVNALANAMKAASAQLVQLLPKSTSGDGQMSIIVSGLPSDMRSRLMVALELDNK